MSVKGDKEKQGSFFLRVKNDDLRVTNGGMKAWYYKGLNTMPLIQ